MYVCIFQASWLHLLGYYFCQKKMHHRETEYLCKKNKKFNLK